MRELLQGPITPEERALAKEAKQIRRAAKREKWGRRAAAVGIDFGVLSKAQRQEFKLRWRADRALVKLEKVVGRGGGERTATDTPPTTFARPRGAGPDDPLIKVQPQKSP